jgi:hypothetical protein
VPVKVRPRAGPEDLGVARVVPFRPPVAVSRTERDAPGEGRAGHGYRPYVYETPNVIAMLRFQ